MRISDWSSDVCSSDLCAGFEQRQPDHARMTAREKADERLGAALDRIAARLAEPFTARDVTGDLGIGKAFERDYGIQQSGARRAARVGHAERPPAKMAPPTHPAPPAARGRLAGAARPA